MITNPALKKTFKGILHTPKRKVDITRAQKPINISNSVDNQVKIRQESSTRKTTKYDPGCKWSSLPR